MQPVVKKTLWVMGFVGALSRAFEGRWTRAPVAWVRERRDARTTLSLEQRYYAARGERGVELVPKDAYLQQVEDLLFTSSRGLGDPQVD